MESSNKSEVAQLMAYIDAQTEKRTACFAGTGVRDGAARNHQCENGATGAASGRVDTTCGEREGNTDRDRGYGKDGR